MSFTNLHGQQFMNLFTFRKNGTAVKTPVWFAEDAGKLYVMTIENTGKVKRVRATGRVEVGPSDQRGNPTGPVVAGNACILPASERDRVEALLSKKYGLFKLLFDLFGKISGSYKQRVYIEISA
ncbi:MAG: PPOX class F420-dependent oxidoreductase [Roseiflexaceae bacterium]